MFAPSWPASRPTAEKPSRAQPATRPRPTLIGDWRNGGVDEPAVVFTLNLGLGVLDRRNHRDRHRHSSFQPRGSGTGELTRSTRTAATGATNNKSPADGRAPEVTHVATHVRPMSRLNTERRIGDSNSRFGRCKYRVLPRNFAVFGVPKSWHTSIPRHIETRRVAINCASRCATRLAIEPCVLRWLCSTPVAAFLSGGLR